jgi:high-affinity nickel-transport protein
MPSSSSAAAPSTRRGAYGWAFVRPVRKLFYNITITFVSATVALVIGAVEALSLLADALALHGGFWDALARASDSFGLLGYALVGLFVGAWLLSVLVWRLKGYDRMEATGPA